MEIKFSKTENRGVHSRFVDNWRLLGCKALSSYQPCTPYRQIVLASAYSGRCVAMIDARDVIVTCTGLVEDDGGLRTCRLLYIAFERVWFMFLRLCTFSFLPPVVSCEIDEGAWPLKGSNFMM